MPRWEKASPSDVPDWFWRAVDTPSTTWRVQVGDHEVAYRAWGDAEKPSLLLVHGMMAHSHWWDFIAPGLLDRWHVVAIDLGGMGDSDFCHQYSANTCVDELTAVCDHAALDEDVVLIGHSFGGAVSVKAVNRHQERFGSLILVDPGLRPPDEPARDRPRPRAGQIYAERAQAEARFRVQPPQEVRSPYTVRYIAGKSLMPVAGGWTWKFDPRLLTEFSGIELSASDLRALKLPVGLIHGCDSTLCSARTVEYMRSLVPEPFVSRALAEAQHHVFLDQPLEFVRVLRELLGILA